MASSSTSPVPFDQLNRPLRDLRISVTDRCNLRCTYCMPAEIFGAQYPFLPRTELLNFEEITRLARLFVGLGVKKLRLTGGEPTLRASLPELVQALAELPDVEDLAMTSNGILLPKLAPALKAAGLQRVTVSRDSLNPEVFGRMNGLGVHPHKVLDGIEAARAAGLAVKVNTVVQRGVNDRDLAAFWAELRELATVRFIEFMDVGNHNGWNWEQVVSSATVLKLLDPAPEAFAAQKAHYSGEVAQRYQHHSGHEVGLISSVSAPFCGDCSRARLSAVGALYTCLFASSGYDLRQLLREGQDDAQIRQAIVNIWHKRQDRYSEERAEQNTDPERKTSQRPKVEMSHIGG